jgi:hypothetical protein
VPHADKTEEAGRDVKFALLILVGEVRATVTEQSLALQVHLRGFLTEVKSQQ